MDVFNIGVGVKPSKCPKGFTIISENYDFVWWHIMTTPALHKAPVEGGGGRGVLPYWDSIGSS